MEDKIYLEENVIDFLRKRQYVYLSKIKDGKKFTMEEFLLWIMFTTVPTAIVAIMVRKHYSKNEDQLKDKLERLKSQLEEAKARDDIKDEEESKINKIIAKTAVITALLTKIFSSIKNKKEKLEESLEITDYDIYLYYEEKNKGEDKMNVMEMLDEMLNESLNINEVIESEVESDEILTEGSITEFFTGNSSEKRLKKLNKQVKRMEKWKNKKGGVIVGGILFWYFLGIFAIPYTIRYSELASAYKKDPEGYEAALNKYKAEIASIKQNKNLSTADRASLNKMEKKVQDAEKVMK